MNIDLKKVPFSTRGSYLAFTYMEKNFRNSGNEEGLYLRSIHGEKISADGIAVPIGRFIPIYQGIPVPYKLTADATELKLETEYGLIYICFKDSKTLLIKGTGDYLGLTIDKLSDAYSANHIHEIYDHEDTCYMLNLYKNAGRFIVKNISGTIKAEQDWNIDCTTQCSISVTEKQCTFLLVFEEIRTEWERRKYHYVYEDIREGQEQLYLKFLDGMPAVLKCYEEMRAEAAYVTWASIVEPCGFLKREAMYMSKNWMAGIWSWDHCFNAIALSYGHSKLAWDQFMILFDYQDTTGLLPDVMDDRSVNYNWCKPPVHGWALRKMREHMDLSKEQVTEAYVKLGKWTNWWLNYRDDDQDGILEYYHGNDSGWDNGSTFKVVPPVETPDLAAFMVIQMDVLSELAVELELHAESAEWKERADNMLDQMLIHCFKEGKPVAVTCKTHEQIDSQSLLLYMPLVLGRRLPKDIWQSLKYTVLSERYHTLYGISTEALDSADYEEDGYWRGAIWAPTTLLLVDGLYQIGAYDEAIQIAREFCEMVKKSGFAENFNAKTGEGLRDRAYTWTASIFLVLANQYLK